MATDNDTAPVERWLSVPGYEGWYSVSDRGRVRRDRGGERCRAGWILKVALVHGYPVVNLCKDGTPIRFPVHRLVLLAFVGPCPPGMQCRHLDGRRTNNRLINLCWGTSMEDGADRKCHGRIPQGDKHYSRSHPEQLARGSRHGQAKLTEEKVRVIRARLVIGERVAHVAHEFGVERGTVRAIRDGRTWKHVR